MPVQLKRRDIIFGIQIFLILTIIGVSVVFYLTSSEETWQAVKNFQIKYLFMASGLILIDFFSGAARINIFVKRILSKDSFWACFKANLANIFLAAATPFQTGGGIAQIYILNRHGVPYAGGVTVSVLNFVATLSLLFLSATVVITIVPTRLFVNQILFKVMDLSRFAFYFTLILFLLFMVRPNVFGKVFQRIFYWLSGIFPSKKDGFQILGNKIIGFIEQYRDYLYFYWKHKKIVLVWNYLLTIILYFNKCVVAYIIFLGLGLTPNFWEVVMLQMLIIFFLYFAPTPGASFIAETSTSAVMSLIAPAYLLTLFTVLWRFFTTYFGVLIGSLVLLKSIGQSLSTSNQATKTKVEDEEREYQAVSKRSIHYNQ